LIWLCYNWGATTRNPVNRIRKERKPVLPFRKKILYYGLMLALTLLASEGMARLAYYAAYGTGYGGGVADGPDNLTPPPSNHISSIIPRDATRYYEIRHRSFLETRPGITRYGIPFTALPAIRPATT